MISLSLGEIVNLLDDLDSDDILIYSEGNRSQHGTGQVWSLPWPGSRCGQDPPESAAPGASQKRHGSRGREIDSRMGGVMLPAMTLAGSGNQGIAAGTPIVAAADFATIDDSLVLIKSVTLIIF